jgi:hypothetical protein
MALLDVNFRPAARQLRQFGVAGVLVFGLLGAVALWRHHIFGIGLGPPAAHVTGLVLCALAAICALLVLVAPRLLLGLYLALTLVGMPIGYVISHVTMAVLYYGVFTPVGLIMRLVGRDVLHRRFDRSASTYWVARQTEHSVDSYFRQF